MSRPTRVAASLAAALTIFAAGGIAAPATAPASSTQRTLFQAPRELLGTDPALRARTLAELRGLGVRDLRVVLYWKDVAPATTSPTVPGFRERDPAAYDWGRYGAAIDAASAAGFRVLLTVTGPVPRWATATRKDDRTRPSPRHFQRFFEAVARRFGAEVDRYSVWNEPNHPRFLLPQYIDGHAASGTIYRGLYLAARRGLKAAGQSDRPLLFGETAPRGTSRVVAPLRFLRQALCLTSSGHRRHGCHELHVDAIAHHPYTTHAGPTFVPPGRDDVTIGVLGRLTRLVASAERAHAIGRHTPVSLTEFGIQSLPDPYVGVLFTTQAEYRSMAELAAYRRPRVNLFSQYLLRDDEPRPGPAAERYSGFETGLRSAGGTAKRAYDAFRLPLVARPLGRTRIALWGLVRPASGRTTVVVDFRARGGKRWHRLKRVATTARGTWSTHTVRHGDRRYRVRWTAPDGTTRLGPLTRVHRL